MQFRIKPKFREIGAVQVTKDWFDYDSHPWKLVYDQGDGFEKEYEYSPNVIVHMNRFMHEIHDYVEILRENSYSSEVEVGDWIITDIYGAFHVFEDHEFKKLFEIIP